MDTNDILTYEQLCAELKPITLEELAILSDPIVRMGLSWGKPRPGHGEGQIYKHVQFIWENIDTLSHKFGDASMLSGMTLQAVASRGGDLWKKLRLIALLHDTFKFQVDPTQSKSGENHHAMRARRYAEQKYPAYFNESMLDILELHDEAYNAWCKGDRDAKWDKAEKRGFDLRQRLSATNSTDLFIQFFTCDTHVGDLERPDWQWWVRFCLKNFGDDYGYQIASIRI